MTKLAIGVLCSALWLMAGCSSVPVPGEVQHATNTLMNSRATAGTCCIDHAFYECPTAAATTRCTGSNLPLCMSNCGSSQSCQERCVENESPNPSGCTRNSQRDGECEGSGN